MMWRTLALLIAVAFVRPAMADEQHAYTIKPLPPSNTGPFQNALILDQKTGDLWEYTEAPGTSTSQPYKEVIFIGKLRPGDKSGETIADGVRHHQ